MVRVVLILGLAPAAWSAGGKLTNARTALLWSGTVARGSGAVAEVAECSPGCQRFDVTVSLPSDVWKKPGGVQIAIRWKGLTNAMEPTANFPRTTADNLGDNLKLYVYRDRSLIAASDGSTSLAQSVLLNEAPNQTLRVYVAFDSNSPSRAIAYEGLAEVEYRPSPTPVRRLLPDLEARPQRHVTFDPGRMFPNAIAPENPSCYYTEVEEEGARTCLRFDQVFANTGEGPLEIRFAVPHASKARTFEASQRLYWSDDPKHIENRRTGQVEFHPEHAHYHVMTFAVSRLWSIAEPPNLKNPTALKLARTGSKVSFCMVDTEIDAWAQKGDDPRTWKAPDCNFPVSKDATADYYAQGITKGWRDVYEWYLPHQYIEVTGLPDGTYILETVADPDNLLLESNKSNNCGSIYIRLSGVASKSPSAEIVGAGPPCSALIQKAGW